jgi:16S rRNA (adenine(1408)-N(1))-methyltransferase
VGTGDGRFVLDQARQFPNKLCIGIDASADALREVSHKAAKKPPRGGAANALFVWATAENLPPELTGLADEITINYPWGSLLKAVVQPDVEILKGIRALARPGASLTILINLSVFENHDYCQKLGLPPLDLARAQNELVSKYYEAGIETKRVAVLEDDVPHQTTWGQKLILGSDRKTLMIKAAVIS